MTDYRKDAHWSVYIHIVPKAITGYDHDKYYVGLTSKNVLERWGNKGYGYRSQLFYKPIQKYGWDNIEHEVIAENITEQEAGEFEEILIEKLNTRNTQFGYNIQKGGATYSIKSNSKRQKDRHKVKIYKFDVSGQCECTYESMMQTAEIENIPINRLENILLMHYIYNESIFAREEYVIIHNDVPILSPFYNPRNSIWQIRVHQFDLRGHYLNSYESISEAEKQTKVSENVIRRIIHHNNTRIGNSDFIWAMDSDVKELEDGTFELTYLDWFTIFQFDRNGNYITRYVSCKNASEITQIPYDIIHGQLRARSTKRLSADHQYIWRKINDVEYQNNTYIIKELKDTNKILGIDVFQFDRDRNYIAKFKNAKVASEQVDDITHGAILRQVKNPPKNPHSKYLWRGINDVEKQSDGTYILLR